MTLDDFRLIKNKLAYVKTNYICNLAAWCKVKILQGLFLDSQGEFRFRSLLLDLCETSSVQILLPQRAGQKTGTALHAKCLQSSVKDGMLTGIRNTDTAASWRSRSSSHLFKTWSIFFSYPLPLNTCTSAYYLFLPLRARKDLQPFNPQHNGTEGRAAVDVYSSLRKAAEQQTQLPHNTAHITEEWFKNTQHQTTTSPQP